MKDNGDQENHKLIPHRYTKGHADEDAVKQNSDLEHKHLHDVLIVLLLLRQLELVHAALAVGKPLDFADSWERAGFGGRRDAMYPV
jgi:hypothetical protein